VSLRTAVPKNVRAILAQDSNCRWNFKNCGCTFDAICLDALQALKGKHAARSIPFSGHVFKIEDA
jgi:hypothetical protein